MAKERMLTNAEAAAYVGIEASTWRKYVSEGRAPAPDDPELDRPANRRMPKWKPSTLDRWRANRPGQGRRTDLNKAGAR